MKKFLALFLVCLVLCGCGCGKQAEENTATDSPEAEETFDVVVCLSNQLGDKAQSDALYKGCEQIVAEDPSVTFKFLESVSSADWEPNIIAALEGDYDLVFITAASMKDLIIQYAPLYPDKKIVAVDGIIKDIDNVMSGFTEQNIGSFVMGACAAMWTTNTDIPGVNADKIVGWIGGMENPTCNDFYVGFEAGVKYIDEDIQVLKGFAGSFQDPLMVKELALTQYDQGADVIMAVASSAGQGLFEAATEKQQYAIGLDENQDNQAPGYVITSFVKNASMITYNIIKQVKADPNSFVGGSIYSLDFSNGGISTTDFAVIKESLGDKFPEDLIPALEKIIDDINNGVIKVPEYEGVR